MVRASRYLHMRLAPTAGRRRAAGQRCELLGGCQSGPVISVQTDDEAVDRRPRWRVWRDQKALHVPNWAWPVLVVFVTAALGAQKDHPWLVVAWLGAVSGVAAAQLSVIALEPATYAAKAASVIGSIVGLVVLLLLVWHIKELVIFST